MNCCFDSHAEIICIGVYICPHCSPSLLVFLSSGLELQDRKASRIDTWEAIQKENLLSARNKQQRESDTARLQRTSIK